MAAGINLRVLPGRYMLRYPACRCLWVLSNVRAQAQRCTQCGRLTCLELPSTRHVTAQTVHRLSGDMQLY